MARRLLRAVRYVTSGLIAAGTIGVSLMADQRIGLFYLVLLVIAPVVAFTRWPLVLRVLLGLIPATLGFLNSWWFGLLIVAGTAGLVHLLRVFGATVCARLLRWGVASLLSIPFAGFLLGFIAGSVGAGLDVLGPRYGLMAGLLTGAGGAFYALWIEMALGPVWISSLLIMTLLSRAGPSLEDSRVGVLLNTGMAAAAVGVVALHFREDLSFAQLSTDAPPPMTVEGDYFIVTVVAAMFWVGLALPRMLGRDLSPRSLAWPERGRVAAPEELVAAEASPAQGVAG